MKEEMGMLFVRPASGLVRAIGPIGGLALSLPAAVGPLQITSQPQVFAIYNGADIPLSFLMASIVVVLEALVAMELGIAMPRSGGLYVAAGRILGPIFGGIEGWRAVIQNGFFNGMNSFLTGGTIGTMLLVLGRATGNAGLASTGGALLGSVPLMLLVGVLIITVGSVVDLLGPRFLSQYMFIFGAIGVLFLIPGLASLFSNPASAAPSIWDARFGAGAYNEVVNLAKANGWSAAPWTWQRQAMAVVFPFLIMIGYNPLMLGGEISKPKKSLPIACVGSALLVCGFNYLSVAGLKFGYGSDFMSQYTSLQYGGQLGNLKISPGVPVSTVLFASAGLPLPFAAMTLLAPIFGQIAYMPMATFYTTRTLFALSFDRMAPEVFAATSRWGSPKNSILFFYITSLIGLGLSQVAISLVLLNVLVLYTVCRLFFIASTALMPVVKPEIWKQGFAWKVGGIPVDSILGGIVAVPVTVILLMTCAGLDVTSILEIAAIVIIGAALFLYYSLRNQRKGIDVSATMGVLPPA